MKKIIFILFTSLLTINSFSQEETTKDHTVGLVLSGGGAKGFAHIGVIEEIEKAGIRVDYVGGTSMGAVIAGLYAAGYDAASIKKIIVEMDFDGSIGEKVKRKDMPFYEKENESKYVVKLAVKDKQIKLPSGLSTGESTMNVFSKYTQHVSTVNNFDDLPIPFLCIATDLEKGKQVVLDHGYLPDAVKASASYPTLVKPIEIDGKLLVDGGIVNNFPVDEIRMKGADIIIGVDVGSNKLYTKKDLNSVVNIIDQLISYQMVTDEIKAKKERIELYLNPKDSKYSLLSFSDIDSIVALGAKTAKEYRPVLEKIAALQNTKKIAKTLVKVPDTITIKGVHIRGNKHYTYSYIIEKMQLNIGKKITFDELFRGFNRLLATQNFSDIQHQIEVKNNKDCIIHLKVTEDPIDTFIKLGIHYDHLFKTGALVNITKKHLLFDNDILAADIIIGQKPRFNFSYFVDNGTYTSIGINAVLQHFDFDSQFIEENSTYSPTMNYQPINYFTVNNKIFGQAVYKENIAIGLGIHHQYIKASTDNHNPLFNTDEIVFKQKHYTDAFGFLKLDTFDERTFPKSGITLDGTARWFILEGDDHIEYSSFVQGQLKFGFAHTLLNKLTLQIRSEAGISLGNNHISFLDFHLGGTSEVYQTNFITFYGYPFASFGDKDYVKTRLTFRYELFKNNYISAIANVARANDNLFEDALIFNNTRTGYALEYGYKSIVGPVLLSYSYSPEIHTNYWNFKLGYWF